MSSIQIQLIRRAIARYGNIQPCGNTERYSNSFSIYKNSIYFWFNTSDGSTHVECERVPAVRKIKEHYMRNAA